MISKKDITNNKSKIEDERIKLNVYTVEDIQKMLGINKNKTYELVMSGQFPAKKLGRRILIPKITFDEWLCSTNNQK